MIGRFNTFPDSFNQDEFERPLWRVRRQKEATIASFVD